VLGDIKSSWDIVIRDYNWMLTTKAIQPSILDTHQETLVDIKHAQQNRKGPLPKKIKKERDHFSKHNKRY